MLTSSIVKCITNRTTVIRNGTNSLARNTNLRDGQRLPNNVSLSASRSARHCYGSKPSTRGTGKWSPSHSTQPFRGSRQRGGCQERNQTVGYGSGTQQGPDLPGLTLTFFLPFPEWRGRDDVFSKLHDLKKTPKLCLINPNLIVVSSLGGGQR